MAGVEVISERSKLRSSARISNVKTYSENCEELDEFIHMDEGSTKNLRPKKRAKLSTKKKGELVPCEIPVDLNKDLRPKKRARMSVKKIDKLVPSEIAEISTKKKSTIKRAKMFDKKKNKLVTCETPVGEIKPIVLSNVEQKFFPIFISSPKLRIQQIFSSEKISIDAEPKVDFSDLSEKSPQNHNDVNQTEINGRECNEHEFPPVGKQMEVASDLEEDSKVISVNKTTAICINKILVKDEEVSKTDQILKEPDDRNIKNNLRQNSCNKVRESPTTNENCSDCVNSSSQADESTPLKKKRKKKNEKVNISRSYSFFKNENECKILNKGDLNTTDELKSPEINNEMKIKETKPALALKLFPIFSNSHSLAKTSKPSPEAKEKNKPYDNVKENVQQTKQLSCETLDDVQTEQLYDNITESVQIEQLSDDVTDGMQSEQLLDDITDGVQADQLLNDITDEVHLSDNVSDGVQAEQLSDDVTDGVKTEQQLEDITDIMQTDQLSNNITNSVLTKQLSNGSTDCVQTMQLSIMKNTPLRTSSELSTEIIVDESTKVDYHNSAVVNHPVRTRRKRKLNKSDNDSSAVSSTGVTRSQTIKNNSNTSHIPTALSNAKSDNVVAKKCDGVKKKLQQNKTRTYSLKLLSESHQCFKKKEKNNTNVKQVNPTKLFSLFSKSQIAVEEKKSISQLNSLEKKRMKNNAQTPKSSRISVAHDSEDDLFDDNNTNYGKAQTRNNPKVKNNSKVLKKKNSDLDIVEISDDSIVEVTDTENSKVETEIVKLSESAHLEPMNRSETLVEKNTTTMPRKKQNNSSKSSEMYLSFPLISQYCALDKEFDSCISKHFSKEDDISSEINIPLWNKIVGLTDIESIDGADMVLPTQNIHKITEIEHADETNNILWTDISNDYNLKEGVSESTISDLNLWLSQWKSKFTKDNKSKHNDSDDSFDSFSSDSNDSEAEGLSNSIIIMGPSGCGKTSLVFSLANDHGFKVLEVNASSSRNGRNISHQLKEALESYHVENIKTASVNFQKETCEEYDEDSVLTKPKKNKIAENTISDYLKRGRKSSEGENVKKKSTMKNFFQVNLVTKNSDENQKLKKTVSEQHQSTTACPNDSSCTSSSRSISTRTIILFDDIDVVFQEDEGLWSTIRNFLKISKKPVIFTVSRNLAVVKANLDSDIRVLYLKPMVEEVAIEKINGQYETYGRKNSNINMKLLVNNSCDMRRNLLHAQFWSQPCDIHTFVESNKVFSTNTFFLGSLNFNAVDFISLILKNKLPNSYSLISEYHKIGYDLLHSNLFTILNGTDASCIARSWQSVTKRTSKYDCDSIESFDTEHEHTNGIGESDLWKEACKIFELKKQRLQKGSSSEDLFIFSDVLEHFSFSDSLKGCFYKNMKWISQPERNRMWSQGLPACSEDSEFCSCSSILDMVSLVQMFGLQLAQSKYSSGHQFKNDDKERLVLEHPFINCDEGNEVNTQLESIASEFSASHMLNKTAFNLDYLSTLKIICREELLRRTKSGKRSNRFLHYFDSISLYIDKSQIEKCVE